ncbi:MAG: hypothetical protein F4X97_09140 [Boseongicola sp. SB0662_bin_57]|nr:hypothetical protein [Boseongicola sp. SB0662_bin_57]
MPIAVDWPPSGAAGWASVPSKDCPWTIAPEELFCTESKEDLDGRGWFGQQLVMFEQRGITLKDVIRMVATFEGVHSLNAS